jgi:hypothetical protein
MGLNLQTFSSTTNSVVSPVPKCGETLTLNISPTSSNLFDRVGKWYTDIFFIAFMIGYSNSRIKFSDFPNTIHEYPRISMLYEYSRIHELIITHECS